MGMGSKEWHISPSLVPTHQQLSAWSIEKTTNVSYETERFSFSVVAKIGVFRESPMDIKHYDISHTHNYVRFLIFRTNGVEMEDGIRYVERASSMQLMSRTVISSVVEGTYSLL